jgi:hypothetical protein
MLAVDVVVSGEEFPFLRESNIRLAESEGNKKKSISPIAPETSSKESPRERQSHLDPCFLDKRESCVGHREAAT